MRPVAQIGLSHSHVRLGLCLLAAVVAGWVSYTGTRYPHTDFAQLWHGARALAAGTSPYAAVGPGRAFEWSHPLLYPLPAVLLALPFAAFPLRLADALFVAAGALALSWAVTRDRLFNAQWWAFASSPFRVALSLSQWSPLFCGATAVPALGLVLVCKPAIGAALWFAYPSRRAFVLAAGFAGLSVLCWPWWVPEWLAGLSSATHIAAPVQHVAMGGPLILLALLKWRRPEARLLACLACAPQSMFLYEALPLFLVVRRWYEGLALTALSWLAAALPVTAREVSYDAWAYDFGDHIVLWLYLPCLVAVLCRPNVSVDAVRDSAIDRTPQLVSVSAS